MTVMMSAPIDQEDEEVLVPHADLPENNHQPMEVVAQPETANAVESQPVVDPPYAQFSLAIVNQVHNKFYVRKDTQHQFNARESDWGFTSFMPLGELYDPGRGYLVNDTLIIEVEVLVRKIVDYWNYDSKKEIDYVGLKNQGATCYMNSLLQTLYHIPYFRKVVYHMPTTENDMPSGSIHLALQSLFYKLQYSDTSVATKELTKSFGWDTYDSFSSRNRYCQTFQQ
ncbi:hypothetical protein KIW84_022194 [Lathyrus oleraceus]|uniref:Uncharacterized protein n=1 Tax=Pisum sativum TaxID=3888 RepID=A0A9D4YCJ9_PEA|nr:hypothetical protein KIW84_022194 [Pisum sativum]